MDKLMTANALRMVLEDKSKNTKFDLHCHSVVSDGTKTLVELLQEAKANGVKVFSVTDHDTAKAYEPVATGIVNPKDYGVDQL